MRLTKKIGIDEYTSLREIDDNQVLLAHRRLVKLGQLEDLEEEYGIGLVILFNKATKEVWYKKEIIEYDVGGNWYKELDKNIIIHNSIVSRLDFQYKQVYIKGAKQWFNIKDYGKTWALTKDELL